MRCPDDVRAVVTAFFFNIFEATMLYHRYRSQIPRSLPAPKIPFGVRQAHRAFYFDRLFRNDSRSCYNNLRMHRESFFRLCTILKSYGLSDSRFVNVQEQVAIFLLCVGHDQHNRTQVLQFIRSGEIISRSFHKVLDACLKLFNNIVTPPTLDNSTVDGGVDCDWHHYFEDAIGAIDGTHFPVNVPLEEQARYRDRNGALTQNVLVAVTFDMKFRYVLAGWEGSAHDGRVLRCAVSRRGRRLTIPQDKYYLADAGYANVTGFLTPYRGVRYHLREKKGRTPENAKELYNFYHSSLRNVVERSIGVLKKRFAYLRNGTFHDVGTQAKIVLACCALHNFIRDADPFDFGKHLDDITSDEEVEEGDEDDNEHVNVLDYDQLTIEKTPEWTHKRNVLMNRMWEDYISMGA